jgi:hypothetical protein
MQEFSRAQNLFANNVQNAFFHIRPHLIAHGSGRQYLSAAAIFAVFEKIRAYSPGGRLGRSTPPCRSAMRGRAGNKTICDMLDTRRFVITVVITSV